MMGDIFDMCVTISQNAAKQAAALAASDLSALTRATSALNDAGNQIDKVSKVVDIGAELFAALGVVGSVVASSTVSGIAAAAAAISAVASAITGPPSAS